MKTTEEKLAELELRYEKLAASYKVLNRAVDKLRKCGALHNARLYDLDHKVQVLPLIELEKV